MTGRRGACRGRDVLELGAGFVAARQDSALFVRCASCEHPAWAHGIGACAVAVCGCAAMTRGARVLGVGVRVTGAHDARRGT